MNVSRSSRWIGSGAIWVFCMLATASGQIPAPGPAGPAGAYPAYGTSPMMLSPYAPHGSAGAPAVAPYGVMPASYQQASCQSCGDPCGGSCGGGSGGGCYDPCGGGRFGGCRGGLGGGLFRGGGCGPFGGGGLFRGGAGGGLFHGGGLHGRHGGYGHGMGAAVIAALLPYADGGNCAPRWYDISADFMYLSRDINVDTIPFSTDNIGGNVVLSSADLDFASEPGFRISGAYQTGPGSNLEITYMGAFHFSDNATATSANDSLYSTFSQFGNFPFNGFEFVDMAELHHISYGSQLNTIELDYRRRIVGANCRLHGSWLVGFRWLRLTEDFRFYSEVSRPDIPPAVDIEGTVDHTIHAANNLFGGQLGGDLWLSVIPGFKIGMEGKAGVYGNGASQDSRFRIDGLGLFPAPATDRERVEESEVSFVGELNLMAVWRVNHNVALKAGYHVLYVDQVALALDNFNSQPPDVFAPIGPPQNNLPVRQPLMDTNGNATYGGFTFGFEYMW